MYSLHTMIVFILCAHFDESNTSTQLLYKKDRSLRDIPLCVQLSPIPAPHPALPTDCLSVMGFTGAHTGSSGPIHQEERHLFSCLYYRIRDAILRGSHFLNTAT